MTIREAWEKKKAAQAAAGQAAARSGETVAPNGRQPGKLKKLFSKTSMAIAATTMLTAAVVAATGGGSGSGSGCPKGWHECSSATPDGTNTAFRCCPPTEGCLSGWRVDAYFTGRGWVWKQKAWVCCDDGEIGWFGRNKDGCPSDYE